MGFASLNPSYRCAGVLGFAPMSEKIVKRPGADWDVRYIYLDGSRECMSVFGCATPEEAIAEARWSRTAVRER
jgi:hypothetical protein